METPTQCPKCQSEDIYYDGSLWICPICSHEWMPSNENVTSTTVGENDSTIRDANGNTLADGDSVTVIKELKIKGSTSAVKVGTKVKNIRLVDAGDGHNISCKIDGLGSINLKSQFVKKA